MTAKRLAFVTRHPDQPVPERIRVLAAAMGLEVAVVDFNAPQLPPKPLMVWVDEAAELADVPREDRSCPRCGMACYYSRRYGYACADPDCNWQSHPERNR